MFFPNDSNHISSLSFCLSIFFISPFVSVSTSFSIHFFSALMSSGNYFISKQLYLYFHGYFNLFCTYVTVILLPKYLILKNVILPLLWSTTFIFSLIVMTSFVIICISFIFLMVLYYMCFNLFLTTFFIAWLLYIIHLDEITDF